MKHLNKLINISMLVGLSFLILSTSEAMKNMTDMTLEEQDVAYAKRIAQLGKPATREAALSPTSKARYEAKKESFNWDTYAQELSSYQAEVKRLLAQKREKIAAMQALKASKRRDKTQNQESRVALYDAELARLAQAAADAERRIEAKQQEKERLLQALDEEGIEEQLAGLALQQQRKREAEAKLAALRAEAEDLDAEIAALREE